MRDGSDLCSSLSNAEKFRSEMALKGKLNCNKYINFLTNTMEEIWVCKGLFF